MAHNNLVPRLGPEEVQEDTEGMLFHVELHGKKKKRIVWGTEATGTHASLKLHFLNVIRGAGGYRLSLEQC